MPKLVDRESTGTEYKYVILDLCIEECMGSCGEASRHSDSDHYIAVACA